jgi:chromate transporter
VGTRAAPPIVSLREALSYWLKLGFVSFGGPAGQISLMHSDLVERRRWISEGRFLHALNYVMVLPGPEAQQLATYIGWLMHGTWGGIVAGVLFVAPSLVILCALSWIYLSYGDAPAVAGVLYGIKPAVTAIVVFAAYRIGSRAVKGAPLIAVACGAFAATVFFDVPFPLIIAIAAAVGFVGGRAAPHLFHGGAGQHAAAAGSGGPAVIDDHTPTPLHARFGVRTMILYAVLGLGVWALLQGLLIAYFGGVAAGFASMGWFFTKAALLTFGGAYAVLPYVYQGGVETHGWVTATQMIDGLALGETTPGPLIMVVAFVGFVGAWTQELLGPDRLLAAGVLGAAIATLFTFLPSFLFVLIGGPMVEATRHDLSLAGPLTGITAAVVGVILSLAVFFAWHVLWPTATEDAPFSGRFDWVSLLIVLAALLALWRFKVGVIPVIGACALAGLALWLIGGVG